MVRIYGARPSDIALLGGPRPRVGVAAGAAQYADLRQYCTYVDNQNGNKCVGESFKGADWIVKKASGKTIDSRGIYVLARSRERLRSGDALPDTGCMPADAYAAAVAVGVYPGDASENDPAAVNKPLTWDQDRACVKLRPEAFEPLADGDTSTLDESLSAGMPATYTQPVDSSYENLSSSSPVWRGPQVPLLGYHRQVIVGRILVTGFPCYVVWNSWGSGWGDSGFSYIPCDVFSQLAGEVVVHREGVVF